MKVAPTSGGFASIRPVDVDQARARVPHAFRGPLHRVVLRWGLSLAALAYLVHLAILFQITPGHLWDGITRQNGVLVILRQMVDWRDWEGWLYGDIFNALGQTVAMSVVGTLAAAIVAVPLGFLSARNVVPSWILRFGFRRISDTLRGVDQIVWALVFVRAVGLGPLAGVLAIFVAEVGTLAKLYGEAIEAADRRQVEGVRATGAGRLAVMRFGVLPQVLPIMLSQALYEFESNTRTATILGLVGAGGIGLAISQRIAALYWDQVAFILILVVITVMIIDWVSKRLRQRIIGGAERRS